MQLHIYCNINLKTYFRQTLEKSSAQTTKKLSKFKKKVIENFHRFQRRTREILVKKLTFRMFR